MTRAFPLVLLLSACKPPASSTAPLSRDRALVGVWADAEGQATTIAIQGSSAQVIRVVDHDDEVFEVLRSGWEGGAFSWTYSVPSTQYTVTMSTPPVTGDAMTITWSNVTPDGAQNSGTEVITRQAAAATSRDFALVGVWSDAEGQATTIEVQGSSAQVIRVVDYDGEVFEVLRSGWEGEVFSWTYLVPSTQYTVTMSIPPVTGDAMTPAWSNVTPDGTQNSGTDSLTRGGQTDSIGTGFEKK